MYAKQHTRHLQTVRGPLVFSLGRIASSLTKACFRQVFCLKARVYLQDRPAEEKEAGQAVSLQSIPFDYLVIQGVDHVACE